MKTSERIEYIRETIERKGITQVALAEEAGISTPYCNELLRGKHPRPGADTMLSLETALKTLSLKKRSALRRTKCQPRP